MAPSKRAEADDSYAFDLDKRGEQIDCLMEKTEVVHLRFLLLTHSYCRWNRLHSRRRPVLWRAIASLRRCGALRRTEGVCLWLMLVLMPRR
jgi:hypothetical protein